TKLRDHAGEGSPGWKSAQITGQVLNIFAVKDEAGADRPAESNVPPAMRDSMAKIVSAYLVDFVSAQSGSRYPHGKLRTGDPIVSTRGQSYGVHVSVNESKYLLEELVKDPRAVEHLLDSELVLADSSLQYAGSLLRGGSSQVSVPEAKELYLAILRHHGAFLRLLEGEISRQEIEQGAEYDAKVKRSFDKWSIVAKTGLTLVPRVGDVAAGVFDWVLIDSSETVKAALLTNRAGLAQQKADENRGSLVDKLRQIAVRRAFADDLYFTGLLENPVGYSRETAWKLPFLGPDFRVKLADSLSDEEWSDFF
ncbi:MAG: hypothetical protein ACRC0L_08825, partial [Angustibacter sp.]